jgi:hypothetical protein
MQLPPKRFQSDGDPKYDSIRHLPWFRLLAERREKIAVLEQAYKWKRETFCVHTDGHRVYATQTEAARTFAVDERELRDFIDFREGRNRLAEIEPDGTRRAFQAILDQAYDVYCDTNGRKPFVQIIRDESRLFGIDGRQAVELWDVDPGLYPAHYRGLK